MRHLDARHRCLPHSSRHQHRITVAAALVLGPVIACAPSSPIVGQPSRAASPVESGEPSPPCAGSEFEVRAAAASAGAPSADLTIRRRGQPMSAARAATCLRTGTSQIRIPPGQEHSVAIPADATRLQRIQIGGATVLLYARPGARLGLTDHPCFGWQLTGLSADPWTAAEPAAYCATSAAQPCRPGYFRPGSPRPAADSLCGGDTDAPVRCAALATVRLDGAPASSETIADVGEPVPVDQLASGATLAVEPRECGLAAIDTGREVVHLAIEVGAHWQLAIDADGRVQGRVVASDRDL